MQPLDRIVAAVERAAAAVAAVSLVALAVLTFVDVIGRYIFHAPVPGAVELIQGLMALLMFGALACATRANEHVRVDMLVDRLPKPAQGALRRLGEVSVFAMTSALAWSLGHHALFLRQTGDLTPVLRLQLWPFAALAFAMAAACAVIALCGLFLPARHIDGVLSDE